MTTLNCSTIRYMYLHACWHVYTFVGVYQQRGSLITQFCFTVQQPANLMSTVTHLLLHMAVSRAQQLYQRRHCSLINDCTCLERGSAGYVSEDPGRFELVIREEGRWVWEHCCMGRKVTCIAGETPGDRNWTNRGTTPVSITSEIGGLRS